MTEKVGSWKMQFPGNLAWSNATLVTKGMAPYGAIAMAEVDEVCQRLDSRQAEPDAWREEWSAMGQRIEAQAEAAAARGHERTAGNAWLRAGMYFFTAERFIYPGEEKRSLGERAIRCQQAGLLRRHPNIEKVEVPFGETTLPALFMKADTRVNAGPAPTIVVFDGMDNCKEMSVLFCGLEFAARGWNTLAIDGPGQGETLRLRGLYARHDYEVAGTAALDCMLQRGDVDPDAVVVMGYSFGGYYAARVAAFEQRYAAGVTFAALHWDLAAFQREVLKKQLADPKATAQSAFHFAWIMGCLGEPEAAIRKAEQFSLQGVADKVTMPFLVVHGAEDKVVPVAAARKLYDELGSRDRELKIFTTDEGGSGHCCVDNRPLGVDFIADWISGTLSRRDNAPARTNHNEETP
jgi:pimeloyl-ACP methyl ester carboxylesterase